MFECEGCVQGVDLLIGATASLLSGGRSPFQVNVLVDRKDLEIDIEFYK